MLPDIERILKDFLALDEVEPGDILRLLPALEYARARLWLAALRHLGAIERTGSNPPGPGLLTIKEVSGHLRFSAGHVYELVRTGRLRVVRHGRTIRIPREALAEWEAINQTGHLDGRFETLDRRSSARQDRASARCSRVRNRGPEEKFGGCFQIIRPPYLM